MERYSSRGIDQTVINFATENENYDVLLRTYCVYSILSVTFCEENSTTPEKGVKSSRAKWLTTAVALTGFRTIKRLGAFLLPPPPPRVGIHEKLYSGHELSQICKAAILDLLLKNKMMRY